MSKYSYNICNMFDEEIFIKQCQALEKHIPDIIKNSLLIDVDGSQTQLYTVKDKTISVHNSHYIDAVYINSEFDIEPFFNN